MKRRDRRRDDETKHRDRGAIGVRTMTRDSLEAARDRPLQRGRGAGRSSTALSTGVTASAASADAATAMTYDVQAGQKRPRRARQKKAGIPITTAIAAA